MGWKVIHQKKMIRHFRCKVSYRGSPFHLKSPVTGNLSVHLVTKLTQAPGKEQQGFARHDLLELLDRLNPTIAELSQAIEQEAEKCPAAQRLRTHRV
jgi:hypothetical protein